MIRFWDEEKDNYLIQIYKNKSKNEIKKLFNDHFNTTVSIHSIKSRKNRLHIISRPKLRPKYTEEIREYVKKKHKGKSTIELAKEVSDKFKIDCDNNSIQNLKSKIRITDGFIFEPARNDGCIKKGNIPKNKGTKGMYNVGGNITSFKKGNIPHNNVPIGTEKWKAYGGANKTMYLFVKVMDGHLNNNWVPKHRYIYEQHHGKVPKGHKIVFADGDKTNFDINNLILVSNSELLILNRNKLIFNNKELTESGILIAKVIDKVNKINDERL